MTNPEKSRRRFDFHAHTFLTDGESSATDMWFAADQLAHQVLAITDHLALNDPVPLIDRLRQEAKAFEGSPMRTLVGVELSMLPPRRIAEAARSARRAGAEIVIVHGETLAEAVPEGTNRAAVECPDVDLLAHPGLLTPEVAELAHVHGIVLELSARKGHSLSNGHVARTAIEAGAALVVDSDAHATGDLLSLDRARQIARGAGLGPEAIARALDDGPRALLKRIART
jgi:histidinol phosphatase-like PHP family hydrolase